MFNEKLAESAHADAIRSEKSCSMASVAAEKLREFEETVITEVRARPMMALLAAAGVGLLIGVICHRRPFTE